MKKRDEVLVAIMNNQRDMEIAREHHWYRIPVASVEKYLKRRWPPQWLAFYQTKVFGAEAYAINYYAYVNRIIEVSRSQLFPDEAKNEKTGKRYYKLELSNLEILPQPIRSYRRRRITFISTTLRKFKSAVEINDLYDDSPLEDKVWQELKKHKIKAERQELVSVKQKQYFLDFAIYCVQGNIDVETDGDTWHADKKRIPIDNLRDNNLHQRGWYTLRFNTYHVKEEMTKYCIPTIVETINRLGGLGQEGQLVLSLPNPPTADGFQQLNLFQL